MRRFIWVLAIFPMQAGAQEFVVLTGAQIGATLTGHAMVYEDGATQDFHASGRTLYNAGRDSWGSWAVRGDQYCSQWPPTEGWYCYDVTRNGDVIRFIADDGSFTTGTYAQ